MTGPVKMREFLERVALGVSVACVGCKTLPPSASSETQSAITQDDLRGRLSVVGDDSMLGRSAVK